MEKFAWAAVSFSRRSFQSFLKTSVKEPLSSGIRFNGLIIIPGSIVFRLLLVTCLLV